MALGCQVPEQCSGLLGARPEPGSHGNSVHLARPGGGGGAWEEGFHPPWHGAGRDQGWGCGPAPPAEARVRPFPHLGSPAWGTSGLLKVTHWEVAEPGFKHLPILPAGPQHSRQAWTRHFQRWKLPPFLWLLSSCKQLARLSPARRDARSSCPLRRRPGPFAPAAHGAGGGGGCPGYS